ncbi:retrovirus-related pol polyprotein from transposon TNT 1-94 [Tanacetum coccineum]
MLYQKFTQESKVHLKRERPIGFKDKNPRKRKATENAIIFEDIEILLGQTETKLIDEKFFYNVACDVMNGDDDPESASVIQCQIVYVDDLNIIGTNKEINEFAMHSNEEFEMKDLGKTKYCLGLQIEHMPNGILVHQSNYREKVLKCFNMDIAKYLNIPMVGRSLNVDNDAFRPCEEDEDVLGPKVSYLNATGALMYLTN